MPAAAFRWIGAASLHTPLDVPGSPGAFLQGCWFGHGFRVSLDESGELPALGHHQPVEVVDRSIVALYGCRRIPSGFLPRAFTAAPDLAWHPRGPGASRTGRKALLLEGLEKLLISGDSFRLPARPAPAGRCSLQRFLMPFCVYLRVPEVVLELLPGGAAAVSSFHASSRVGWPASGKPPSLSLGEEVVVLPDGLVLCQDFPGPLHCFLAAVDPELDESSVLDVPGPVPDVP